MNSSVMTLYAQREVFNKATAPGRLERALLAAECVLLVVTVALAVVAVISADGRFWWFALAAVLIAGGLAEMWQDKRRARMSLRPDIKVNAIPQVRMALYVLQPQFEDVQVLSDRRVTEVFADSFTLNAAERDEEFHARLADASVRYERVDGHIAHFHPYYRPEEV